MYSDEKPLEEAIPTTGAPLVSLEITIFVPGCVGLLVFFITSGTCARKTGSKASSCKTEKPE